MTLGVLDGPRWVVDGQVLDAILTISVVEGGTVEGKVGRLVDKRSGPGIGTSERGVIKAFTDVDNSEFVSI